MPDFSGTLKKSASIVLASLRPSTYPRGYASALRSLRPRWSAILNARMDAPHELFVL